VAASGSFPHDPAALRSLPGIGAYTATAIAAIAFGVPGVPVDGNVERVVARLFAIEQPLPAAKPAIRAVTDALGADPAAAARPSDFAQALFDLGATICTPAAPACALCPWITPCAAQQRGIQASLPRKVPRPPRPLRHGVHFVLADTARRILLRRRPPSGLLGGMAELPGTAWRSEPWSKQEALVHAPMSAAWQPAGEVRHVFTHFELRIGVYAATVPDIRSEGFLCPAETLDNAGLPSVMRKCLRLLTRQLAVSS
jgi:A/G-specific adenine glycosylase